MARCSASVRPATAGDTTHPMASLYAIAAHRPVLREVGVFNTTTTGLRVGLIRLTSAGTQGTGAVEVCEGDPSQTPDCLAFGTHTGTAPTFTTDAFVRTAALGAAIGSGVIWTFGENGLVIPDGTANGVGVMCSAGTSQICDCYFLWDE